MDIDGGGAIDLLFGGFGFANEALAALKTELREEKTEAELNVSYAMEPLIRSYLEKLSIEFSVEYSDAVAFKLSLTAEQRKQLSLLLEENNLRL